MLAKQSRYINKSLKNIKIICNQLLPAKYLSSFMIFSNKNRILWEHKPISEVIDKIENIWNNRSYFDRTFDNDFTHIYDTLKSAINNVKTNGNLSLTTFVLITDGIDYKSTTEIREILQLVKQINIIILTINVKDLKRICDNAKSGQLLEIGAKHDYGFKSFEDAFSKTKDLIIYNKTAEFVNIRKEFGL